MQKYPINKSQDFAAFAKSSKAKHGNAANPRLPQIRNAVIYTRVSSKEQADKNLSLESQRTTIEEYASRNSFTIAGYFGGTYESAKTDGRKEFQRMLEYVKNSKGAITHILVYILDRFSRTGGGAIQLAENLREQYGVDIIAVTAPADTSNAGGVLQQSIQFIFSKYDNDLRRMRAIKGMTDKFAMGIWVTKPPLGYDTVKVNGARMIVINEDGKKLRRAFEWKAKGMKNEEIIERLEALGVPMYKQRLTKTFKNPFYCGRIAHGLLNGDVAEGQHEALITESLFLKVNNIGQDTSGYGVPHKRERNELPLKVFVICADCNTPFTGYEVKKKGLWYYKCRTKGCRCNKSAKELHETFLHLIDSYSIRQHLIAPAKAKLAILWKQINKDVIAAEAGLKKQITEVEKKMENLEEGYYVNREMSREVFEKFYTKLSNEKLEIVRQQSKSGETISNPEKAIEKALDIAAKLATGWSSGNAGEKEKLQKLIFPERIIYDRKIGGFRTAKTNSVFELIASLTRTSENEKRGQTSELFRLSPLADRTGLEPATSAVTGRRSNQLNYRSFCL